LVTLSDHWYSLFKTVIMVDVSSVKILSKMWSPELKAASPAKKYEHRALEDIKESIMELQYYKQHLWKVTDTESDNKDTNS
jgi:oligoribonuclease (3'-5' exoribonuclease)